MCVWGLRLGPWFFLVAVGLAPRSRDRSLESQLQSQLQSWSWPRSSSRRHSPGARATEQADLLQRSADETQRRLGAGR
ncbi:hypothetical protein F5883DRAFT_552945 [Diaporthe sp. PMI_573]|nr:hypothetical protein F5883DRAFT_552945 [Diaporthaceae sp. PMI_573]